MDDVALYFFSALAQSWAALVAFSGIFLRDRSRRYEDEMQQDFERAVDGVERIWAWLRNISVGYTPDVLKYRDDFKEYFKKNDGFVHLVQHRASESKGESQGKGVLGHVAIHFSYYLAREERRNHVDRWLSRAIYSGGFMVLLALISLALAHWLAQSPVRLYSAISIELLLSVAAFLVVREGFKDDKWADEIQKIKDRYVQRPNAS